MVNHQIGFVRLPVVESTDQWISPGFIFGSLETLVGIIAEPTGIRQYQQNVVRGDSSLISGMGLFYNFFVETAGDVDVQSFTLKYRTLKVRTDINYLDVENIADFFTEMDDPPSFFQVVERERAGDFVLYDVFVGQAATGTDSNTLSVFTLKEPSGPYNTSIVLPSTGQGVSIINRQNTELEKTFDVITLQEDV